jgi:hypothetical protein
VIRCRIAREYVQVDRELAEERFRLDEHVAGCAECARFERRTALQEPRGSGRSCARRARRRLGRRTCSPPSRRRGPAPCSRCAPRSAAFAALAIGGSGPPRAPGSSSRSPRSTGPTDRGQHRRGGARTPLAREGRRRTSRSPCVPPCSRLLRRFRSERPALERFLALLEPARSAGPCRFVEDCCEPISVAGCAVRRLGALGDPGSAPALSTR